MYRLTWRLPLAGLVAFSHLQFSQIRGRQPYSIVRNIPYVIRKFLAKRKIRRKLGDYYGQQRVVDIPPKPRGMWRRTYARHCAALARIERSLYLPRRRY